MSRFETPIIQKTGFTRLSRGDSPQNKSPKVNIIFVHGLMGHPQKTWEHRQIEANKRTAERPRRRDCCSILFLSRHTKPTDASVNEDSGNNGGESAKERRVFWPQDYLLEDVPEAEVWTYGYNADVTEGLFQANNQNSVSQHGRDLGFQLERAIDNKAPIVFVAHSLGGIIVKDAIRRSKSCQSRTKFIVFLGTPHRGSSSVGWGIIASNLAKLVLQDTNKRILKTLEPNGEVLDNIHEEFVRIMSAGNIGVHSFQEAKAMTGVKGLNGKVSS
ncbi:hypothetical protein F5Y10DRAFT_265123 [Nemania abortiva]|nr:hypothetical protein F5Y10DRAFT_265123 [Nemania abortiva]